jgi:hypothetical protein
MRRVLLVIVALVATIVAGSMTPAHADTRSRSDASGDAVHQIDITRLTVRNGDHRVEMRIQVRDLRRRGNFSIHYWGGTRRPPARSAIVTTRLIDDERRLRYFSCDREECERVRCRGMRLDWRPVANVFVISTRQDCFPRPRQDPAAPPPAVGRFFATGEFAGDSDSTDGLLSVPRG